nr:winged helix-turn-helix domain-containing protein [Actinomycetota bacterium]
MRVRLLGGLDIEGTATRQLGSRKARTLLKLLALARSAPVSGDRIADVLWGDDPPARPVEQIGVLVSRLRPVLGAERIIRTDSGWALAVD